MPAQRPGTSEQVVGTPWEFIYAVSREFGELTCDLAALSTNRKAPSYLGPDHEHPELRDSLEVDWNALTGPGLLGGRANWLNPQYSRITPWAKKSAKESRLGAQVLMLVPASMGSNWWDFYVTPHADVYSVGRMKFEGHTTGYPKDLALCHFWKLGGHKTRRWRWEK